MGRIGLDESFIKVINDEGKASFGGSQKWFPERPWNNISGQGCGIIAAVNSYLYIKGKRDISIKEYMSLVEEFSERSFWARWFMHENVSKKAIGILPIQIRRYLNRRLKPHLRAKWNGFNGMDNIYERIVDSMQRNLPVIWALYSMNGKLKFYTMDAKGNYVDNYLKLKSGDRGYYTASSHYVTITGVVENANSMYHKRMVEVSSWGEIFYIDFDEYLIFVGTSRINSFCSNIIICS